MCEMAKLTGGDEHQARRGRRAATFKYALTSLTQSRPARPGTTSRAGAPEEDPPARVLREADRRRRRAEGAGKAAGDLPRAHARLAHVEGADIRSTWSHTMSLEIALVAEGTVRSRRGQGRSGSRRERAMTAARSGPLGVPVEVGRPPAVLRRVLTPIADAEAFRTSDVRARVILEALVDEPGPLDDAGRRGSACSLERWPRPAPDASSSAWRSSGRRWRDLPSHGDETLWLAHLTRGRALAATPPLAPGAGPLLDWRHGLEATCDRRRRPDRRRRARRRADDDEDGDGEPRRHDGADPHRRGRRGRHRPGGRPAREGRRGAQDDRQGVADPRDRRHPLQPHAGAEVDRRRGALHPPEPGQHRRAREGRRGRRQGARGRHADADRRQLRLAAQAPARARAREPRRGAGDRRRGVRRS